MAGRVTTSPNLAYERGSYLGVVTENLIGKRRLHLDMIYMDGLVEAIKRRLMAGSGIAWLPNSSIEQELEQGTLIPIGGVEWESPLALSIYSAPDRFDPIALQVWSLF